MASSNGGNEYKAMAEAIGEVLRPHFHSLEEKYQAGINELGGKLDKVTDRIDKLIETQGGHYSDLDKRVAELERWRTRQDPEAK